MEECQKATPDGMAEQNLLRHMAVAILCARMDTLDRDGAYRMWSTLSEEGREALRIEARPLLPFVMQERARVKALQATVGTAVALNRSIISLAEKPHNADDEYLKGQRVLARKTLYALGVEVQ